MTASAPFFGDIHHPDSQNCPHTSPESEASHAFQTHGLHSRRSLTRTRIYPVSMRTNSEFLDALQQSKTLTTPLSVRPAPEAPA